jgi:hypothetical protein
MRATLACSLGGALLLQLCACAAGTAVAPREPRRVIVTRPSGETTTSEACALACQSALRPGEAVVRCRIVDLDVHIMARLNRNDGKGLLCEAE